MEITIEDEKSINSSVSNRGTISVFKTQKSSKKISFTPTQASETSERYYDLDEKSIVSFETVVQKNNNLKIEPEMRRSSPEKGNCFDLYDEYSDIIRNIKMSKRKNSCNFYPLSSTRKCKDQIGLTDPSSNSFPNFSIKKKKSFVTNDILLKINKDKDESNTSVNKTEEFQKMTNIQEIHNFHEYTEHCMEIIAKMEIPDISTLTKQFVTLPFEKEVGFGKGKKRLAIFDLDETLIHCELYDINSAQKKIQIKMSASVEKTIGLNIRPNYRETISKIKEKYHVIMFTASLQKYADAIMEEIDPNGELFQYRLYRNNCTQIKVDNQIYYIKDLRVFKNISLDDIVIIDNSVLSFAFHLDNGIPILPYYSGSDEIEMNNLMKLLENLADVPHIKTKLRSLMKLYKFIENLKKKQNNLESIEELENINGSFIDQSSC